MFTWKNYPLEVTEVTLVTWQAGTPFYIGLIEARNIGLFSSSKELAPLSAPRTGVQNSALESLAVNP